jgi:hypothetical protein
MIGSEIYLTQEQCVLFQCEYNGSKKLIASANSILASRPGGYDAKHIEILDSLGSKIVVAEPIGHGWFKIIKVAS